MQSNHNDIYKLTALRTAKDEQQYKDIGNYVFSALYKTMRRPKSLIIKLKGIGSWYLRRKRMQIILDKYPPKWEKTKEDFKFDIAFLKHENKIEIYNLFLERIKEYDSYIELRNKIRQERYKDQKPLNNDTETS